MGTDRDVGAATPAAPNTVTMTNDELRRLLAATRAEGIQYAQTRLATPAAPDARPVVDVCPECGRSDEHAAPCTAAFRVRLASTPESEVQR